MTPLNLRDLMTLLGCTSPLTVGPRLRLLAAKIRRRQQADPVSYLGIWSLPSDLRLTKPQQ